MSIRRLGIPGMAKPLKIPETLAESGMLFGRTIQRTVDDQEFRVLSIHASGLIEMVPTQKGWRCLKTLEELAREFIAY